MAMPEILEKIITRQTVRCPDCRIGFLVSEDRQDESIEIRCSFCDLLEVFPAEECQQLRRTVQEYFR